MIFAENSEVKNGEMAENEVRALAGPSSHELPGLGSVKIVLNWINVPEKIGIHLLSK